MSATYVPPASAPSSIRSPGLPDYCPWRHLGELEGVTLTYHDVGPAGLTTFSEKKISLLRGLSRRQRRGILAHELAHIERGPATIYRGEGAAGLSVQVEERLVEFTAAMRLVPAGLLDSLPGLVEEHGEKAACAFLDIDRLSLRRALEAIDMVIS